eukprot:sb/3478870/
MLRWCVREKQRRGTHRTHKCLAGVCLLVDKDWGSLVVAHTVTIDMLQCSSHYYVAGRTLLVVVLLVKVTNFPCWSVLPHKVGQCNVLGIVCSCTIVG